MKGGICQRYKNSIQRADSRRQPIGLQILSKRLYIDSWIMTGLDDKKNISILKQHSIQTSNHFM